MIESPKTIFSIKKLFILMVIFLIITDIAVLFNIQFLRQILGFFFLTFLPGILILLILKLNKISHTEKLVLTVGLSISFLMFFGLLLNYLSLSFGYYRPLSTIFLLISFNLAFIVLASIWYKLNNSQTFSLPNLNLSALEKAFLIIPILLPALSISGMYVMNSTDNNILIMVMLFLIPIYVVFVCFLKDKFPKRLYPFAIYSIGISLLLLLSLRSNHIIGVDTHTEYYIFLTTLNNLHWSIFMNNILDSALSISLLPTIYQSILDLSPEFLFKILYSLLFSISPLVIYVLAKRYIGDFYGFLASLFFMSSLNFMWTPLNARTNIAILFFALTIMTVFNDTINIHKKRLISIIFLASMVLSHYSTTYIFFIVMLGTFVVMKFISKKYTVVNYINLKYILLFFILIFFWYSQVTETPFNNGVAFVKDTFNSFNKFFVEEARSTNTMAMLGQGISQKGIPNQIEFVVTWLSFIFIGVGTITSIQKYKECSFPELNFKKSCFLKEKFDVEFLVIAIIFTGIFGATVALPFITLGYSLERIYFMGIVILSIFFIIGGLIISKYLRVPSYIIILLVLIPYFLSVTGVTYYIFGVPQSMVLNSKGDQYDTYYLHDQESTSAKWLKLYSQPTTKAYIYTDYYGRFRLVSQAGFSIDSINVFSLTRHDNIDGYIYLRYYNVINSKLLGANTNLRFSTYNLTEYDDVFAGKNNIYFNGGSKVYK